MAERTSGGPNARRSAARERIARSLKSNLKNADRKSCKRLGLTYVPKMELTLSEGDVKRLKKEHDILSKKLGLPLEYSKEQPKEKEYIDFEKTN